MSITAMKQALESLEDLHGRLGFDFDRKSITDLRTAIQEAEACEPVAWRIRCTDPVREWQLMYRYPKTEDQFSNMEIQPLFITAGEHARSEPVAFINQDGAVFSPHEVVCLSKVHKLDPLYRAPPAAQPAKPLIPCTKKRT